MNKHFFSIAIAAMLSNYANAQVQNGFSINDLNIQWRVIENSYNGQAKYLSEFIFTNNSMDDFPASGWSIYFNLPRELNPDFNNKVLRVEHVNGDLGRIVPTAEFKGLKSGQSINFQILADFWTLNKADAPGGLYLVWDSAPQNGYPITNYHVIPSKEELQTKRTEGDVLPVATPSLVYKKNESIADIPAQQLTKVFPTPVEYRESQGFYTLTPSVTITADVAFANEANYLANELQKVLGKKLAVVASKGGITLRKAEMGKEAYQLSVTKSGVVISASTPAGAFYGIQSLKTLMPAQAWASKQKAVQVQAVEVKDEPRFGWRAFMMDVARNFQTKEQIIKTLDLLSLYKINVFHFHVVEDEGWRVEIPGLPELTEVGGSRGHNAFNKTQLPPSFNSGANSKSVGSGFYTKADFIEILKYANERHIKVIPEVECPGHIRSAVVAMKVRYDRLMKEGKKEEAEKYLLRDLNDKSVHKSVQGWTDNVMDVSMPSAYKFLNKVVDGFIQLYKEAGVPLETIHMGGDEVPAGSWEKSPAFAKLKQENPSIKTTDDLWYYFYAKVNQIVKSKGLYLYGWEEIGVRKTMLDGKPFVFPNPDFANQNVHLDVWNNVIGWGAEDLAYRLANAGYKVVLSPVSNLYFDMSYTKSFYEEGYYWGGFIDVDKPFSFIPTDYLKNTTEDRMGNKQSPDAFVGKERLTDFGKANIVGLQGALFAETIYSAERMEYMLLPKLLGLSERAWAKEPQWAAEKDATKSKELYNTAWSQFANVLSKRELPRLNYYAGGFKYRIPTAGAIVENGSVKANVQLPGFVIRYTTNGEEPTAKSKAYTVPIAEKATIKLRVFDISGRGGRVEEVQNK